MPVEIGTRPLRQFASFAAVGGLAFLVDAGVLYLAVLMGLGPRFGRLLSYLCAVTVSWECNRRFTFGATRTPASLSNWARFAVAQLGGAAVNLGTYFLLIQWSPAVARFPVIGVAAGSIAGLAINFISARLVVFRATHASHP